MSLTILAGGAVVPGLHSLSYCSILLRLKRWLVGSLDVTLCGFSALHAWNSEGELIFSPKRARLTKARISKARLRFCLERSPKRPIRIFNDTPSRSRETDSPKRELMKSHRGHYCSLL
ncbi:hypothetical protein DEO72_LG3g1686 [Vigna unguiculata]|uniref:Uncharacterized protein n=1 Tax=Vigna unguiculata TaxID=3917 RepID=A0A4D6LEX5_VIGUN|nr:hypothetical protein DEO72_LG3g1686 [Vigna unguiculata]